jgi:hypothetical protein
MDEYQKKRYKIFYANFGKILKEENLCRGCFLPNFLCQNECQKIRIKNSREFWKVRSNLFQEKLSHCCLRKRKIIGDLCLNYARCTRKGFYYNEFLVFISKENKNGQQTKTGNLETETAVVLQRKQRNVRRRESVFEMFSS